LEDQMLISEIFVTEAAQDRMASPEKKDNFISNINSIF